MISENLKHKIISIWPVIFIITLSILVVEYWFSKSIYIIGVDTFFPIKLTALDEYFTIWNNNLAFSGVDTFKFAVSFPFYFLLQLYRLSGLGYDAVAFEKLIIFLFLSIGSLSVYALIDQLFKNTTKTAKTLGGLFYISNVYVIYLFNALPLYLMFSYFFFPFVFYLFVRLINIKRNLTSAFTYGVLSGLILSTSYATPPYIIIHLAILLSYFVYGLFFESPNKEYRKQSFLLTSLFIVAFILANSHWIIPTIITKRDSLTISVESLGDPINQYVSNTTTFWKALNFTGYFGFETKYRNLYFNLWYTEYKDTYMGMLINIFPIVVLSGILFSIRKNRRDIKYLCILILCLIFVVFLSLPNIPGGRFMIEVLSHTPFLAVFRTAYQRFSFPIALFSSILLAYSASRFSEYKYFKYLPLTLILILLYTALPLYRGEMYKSNKYLAPEQVNLPSYYEDSATWMIENSKSLNPRVLIFPYNRLGLATLYNEDASFHYDSNHPYRFISNLGLIYGDGENQLSSYLDKYIYDEATIGTLISHYNIDYIILHNDTNWKYVNDNYWWTGTNFDLIQQQLNNSPCIKPVYTIGALDIYPIDPKCINNLNLIDAEAVPHISQSFKSMPIFGNNLFINTEYTNNDETEELSDFNEVKLVDMASIGAVNYADLWPNTRFSPDNFLYNLSKIKEAYSLLVISDSTKKIDNLIWLMAKRSEELNNWKYISDHAEAGVEQDILSKVDEVLYLIRQNKEVIGEEQLEKTLFYLRKIKKILNNLDDDHLASIIAAVDGLHTEVLTIKNERAYSQCQALCYKIGKTNVEVLYLFNQDFQPLGSVMMNGDRSENFRVFKTDNDYYLEDNTSNENLLEDIEWKTSTDFLSSPSKDGLEFKHFSDILTTNENSIPKIDIEYKSITDIDPTKVYYVEYSYKIVDPQYKFNFTLAEEMYDFSAKDRATIKLKTYRKKEHVYKELDNYIKVKMLYKPNELFAKKGKVYFMFNLTKKENDKNKSNNEDISTIVDIKDIKFYQMQNMTIYASKIEKPFFTLPLDFVNQLTIDYNLEKINPFTYKINFKNLSEEDRLFILNDKYHSDWQIHKDALSVSGPLGLVNKVLPFNLMLGKSLNIEHLEVNDMYNGWKVNSKALVNGEDYYIIFMPQVYLLQGLLITIILSLLAFGVALVNKFGGQQ